jgi:hypothetical protein
MANGYHPEASGGVSEEEEEIEEEEDELGEGGEESSEPSSAAITERTKKAIIKLQVRLSRNCLLLAGSCQVVSSSLPTLPRSLKRVMGPGKFLASEREKEEEVRRRDNSPLRVRQPGEHS